MPVVGMWALLVAGLAVSLLAILAIVGSALPRTHVITRRLTVSKPPGHVWVVIADLGGQLTWRSSLQGVSKVSDPGGRDSEVGEVWREVARRRPIDLKTVEATPPTDRAPGRLVREVATEGLPFRGRWECEVGPAPGGLGSVVTLTERGEVASPVFRAINRLLVGQAWGIETYLRDLARRLGEPARPW